MNHPLRASRAPLGHEVAHLVDHGGHRWRTGQAGSAAVAWLGWVHASRVPVGTMDN